MNWYKIANSISLNDLYPEGIPTNEILYDHIYEEEMDQELNIKNINNLKDLMAPNGDMTIWEAYNQYATDGQKEIVDYYTNYRPGEDIIVLKGNIVLDGHHRVVGAILGGWSLKGIDINELV